jgi:phage terminase large subunit-like protein
MQLDTKDPKSLKKIAEAIQALQDKHKYNKIDFRFPDKGPYRRELYKIHNEFMDRGAHHRMRAFIGPNRSGKSETAVCETVYHLTGRYPSWWQGKRFSKSINAWVVTESGQLFRDSLQGKFLGKLGDFGTGLIPKDCLVDDKGEFTIKSMPGVPGAYSIISTKHFDKFGKFDGYSTLTVKTYEMRREQFQAAEVDWVFLDEECPEDIFTEVLTRTMGTGKEPGSLVLMFTPLKGLTNVVLKFLPDGNLPPGGVDPKNPEKWACQLGWDEVPHLTEADKKALFSEYPSSEREARTRGIPALGSGRIYPILEEDVIVKPFPIPEHWPRAFGLDFGWHNTAALWGAQDPNTKVIYLYAEYKQGELSPHTHTFAIQSKGKWIKGICDPSGGGRNANDGRLLVDVYRSLGLDLTDGDNAITSGIARVLNLFESQQLKIFSTLEKTLKEFRVYRYDSKNTNQPARNQDDHLMDTLRYLTSQFEYVATSEVDEYRSTYHSESDERSSRDQLTGY